MLPVLFLSLATVCTAGPRSPVIQGIVTATLLNVRVRPARHYETIAQLRKGDVVTVVSEEKGWLEIALPHDAKAWVAERFLGPDGKVSVSAVRIHSGPGLAFTSFGKLERNEQVVRVGEARNGWQRIARPKNTTAWVDSSFVDIQPEHVPKGTEEIDRLLGEGQRLFEQKKYQSARDRFEKVILKDPYEIRAIRLLLRVNEALSTQVRFQPSSTQREKRQDAELLNPTAASGKRSPAPPGGKYTVRSGDSLWVLARRFGVKSEEILQLNSLRSDVLAPGQVVLIPRKGSARESESMPIPEKRQATGLAPAVPSAPPTAPNLPPVITLVRPKGDFTTKEERCPFVASVIDVDGKLRETKLTVGPTAVTMRAMKVVPAHSRKEADSRTGNSRVIDTVLDLSFGSNIVQITAVDDRGARASASVTITRERKAGKVYLVAVGINTYPGTFALQCARADAEAFYTFGLRHLRVEEQNAWLFVDEAARKREIMKCFGKIRRASRREDTVVIFLAGHGMIEKDEKYFVPADGEIGNLFGTAIGMDEFTRILKMASDRVLVVADACYSGDIRIRGPQGFFTGLSGQGRILIGYGGPAREDASLGHGYLTHFLLEGLGGAADGDRNGDITLREAYEYASSKVRDRTGAGLWIKGEGNMVFARVGSAPVADQGQSIPTPRKPTPPAQAPSLTFSKTLEHTVSRDETLHIIAEMYGTKVDQIKRANPDLKSDVDLGVNMKILVPYR